MSELLKHLTNKDITRCKDFERVTPDPKPLAEIVGTLESTVYGQPQAMQALGRALLRSVAGINVPNRPEFSGLFLGPPGVGKTETGKALAQYYHPEDQNWEKYLTIVDCSNLSESHSVSKLVGSPPGYVGSGNPDLLLIKPDFFKAQDRTVVVFDEFEKAHPAIWRQMLSVLDRGVLQITAGSHQYSYDTKVHNTDWANTSVIFTTNVGSRDMIDAEKGKSMGFKTSAVVNVDKVREIGVEAVRKHFIEIPELLDRMDAIVVFDPLTPDSYARVLDKFMTQVNDAQRWGMNYVALTREAKNYLVAQTPKDSGGRGLRRTLEKEIMTPVAAIKLTIGPNIPIIAGYDEKKGGVLFWASKKLDQQPEPKQEVEPDEELSLIAVA